MTKKLLNIQRKKQVAEEKEKKLLQLLKEARTQLKELNSEEKRISKKQDTRKKILIGTALLKAVESRHEIGKLNEFSLRGLLHKFISRPSDRKFLNLEPLPPKNEHHIESENLTPKNSLETAMGELPSEKTDFESAFF